MYGGAGWCISVKVLWEDKPEKCVGRRGGARVSDPRSIPHPLFSCALPSGFGFKVKGIGLELSRLEKVELYFIDM